MIVYRTPRTKIDRIAVAAMTFAEKLGLNKSEPRSQSEYRCAYGYVEDNCHPRINAEVAASIEKITTQAQKRYPQYRAELEMSKEFALDICTCDPKKYIYS